MSDWSYPRYALSERIADGTIHALGVILAIIGTVLLLVFAVRLTDNAPVAAIAVYGAALILGFGASALYHMTPWEGPRPIFRRIDHAAIYVKIAATYTPIVALIGSAFAWAVLAVVWLLALVGLTMKLAFWRNPGRIGPFLYLGLGWLSVLLIWPVVQTFPPAVAILILCGGLLYSAGVIFYNWDSLKFSNAIWHGFVLAASGCFFAAITVGTFAPV